MMITVFTKILNRLRTLGCKQLEEDRYNKLLHNITKEQLGLEIGPSLRPCAPKKKGYNVEIVDHLNKEELVNKYTAMGLDASNIEEVDYIWDGRPYSEVTGRENYYDYIIASHVIEHTTDFVGFLQDCSSMLKETGVLSLAIPDKRFTMDHFRMVTTTGKVIDDHLDVFHYGSVGTLIDYAMHVTRRQGLTSWSRQDDSRIERKYKWIHGYEEVKKLYEDSVKVRGFHDIHQYVFTPASFQVLIQELLEYGFIDMGIETIHDTKMEEFIVVMRKMNRLEGIIETEKKMELLRIMSRENIIS